VWTAADISIELVDEMSSGPVTTVRIVTPAGDLLVIGNIENYGRELLISGLHIPTGGLQANSLGWARLRQIAQVVAEKADVDFIIIEGGARTTGAGALWAGPASASVRTRGTISALISPSRKRFPQCGRWSNVTCL
jgi:hypothetical protein